MHRTYLEDFFDGMNDKFIFVFIIFIQIIFIFQKLDFPDAGFTADFYRRIFTDPSYIPASKTVREQLFINPYLSE
ncbi:MAG TPA: hypothetical protein VNW49_18065 [Puia sp.]|nr:hypothetical protein [Puia sp.]